MADVLPGSWAKPDEAPEPLRPFLVEHEEGGYVLNVDVDKDPRVVALASAKERLKGEVRDLKKAVDPWKSIGRSASEVTSALEELEGLRGQKLTGDEALQARLSQVNSQWESKYGERERELADAYSQLDELLVDAAAIKAINDDEGNVSLLLPHVKMHARVVMDNGRRRAVVVDKNGQPRIADVHGNPMEFSGLVKEMKKSETFAVAFKGQAATGTGSKPSTPGGPTTVKSLADLRTDTEKSAFIKEHGMPAYQRLVDASLTT